MMNNTWPILTPESLIPSPESQLPGLYVHIPFCKTKCPYCDFYSVTDTDSVDRWLGALKTEIGIYRELFPHFDSIYLGGGTPSLLDAPTFERLMKILRSHWPGNPDEEVTLEANPDDITREKLSHYRSMGVNRLSLGVQSFDDRELKFLRRRHTATWAKRAIEMVRSCGFANFGIDLMYGLKGQTREKWLSTLVQAVKYDPSHLSCYQLTIESGTPFGLLKAKGALTIPKEGVQRKFFFDTSLFLSDHGFIHYEISNFAKGQGCISHHNTKYWTHAPYLGIGPAAHSFLNGKRWWNYRSVDRYCAALHDGVAPIEGFEILTEDQMKLESLYFGFRTAQGLAVLDLPGPEDRVSRVLEELIKARLIMIRNGQITPTEKGFLVADRIPLMFAV
ncbi:MAG: radical SAM family heme chaperone HemW [Syntrophobacterales bacterium]|jgi:oxygen-independent coproporphyrinogen-3 oxidase|nr:radical SAM family heme chaperone HemW [Syntrophobacterales bacterium]